MKIPLISLQLKKQEKNGLLEINVYKIKFCFRFDFQYFVAYQKKKSELKGYIFKSTLISWKGVVKENLMMAYL